MIVNRAFRYELEPNDREATLLAKHAGTSRFAYNWALARRIERFKTQEGRERFSNAMADHREWNVWKRENAPWAREVSKCAPQEAFRDLDRGFFSFWKGRKKSSGRVGFPRFKKKGRHDSFRLTGTIRVLDARTLQLPRLGRLRSKEEMVLRGRILSASVRREADRWFVSLTVEEDRPEPLPRPGTPIGIDVGLSSFAVLSDGERLVAPKPLGRKLTRLKRLSKRHSRKQKGSRNRKKSAMRLAKLHWRIANARRDFLHKATTRLAKTKPAVVIEDLNVGGLIRNRSLSRAITDAGWSEFRRMLTYKAAWYGMRLIIADRFYPSSKRCSGCGIIAEKLPLSVREWECGSCGARHDRDFNAAMNLAQHGTASRAETAGSQAGNACG